MKVEAADGSDAYAEWDRVTFRLPSAMQGPELEGIAMSYFHSEHPQDRVTGAVLVETTEDSHWVDLWIERGGCQCTSS